jgi:hypothetical protein
MNRVVLATATAFVALTAATHATVTVPTDFRQVVQDASAIVQGHVTDVRALVPVGSPVGAVETVATVAVDATLKGAADAFVSVRIPGGIVGNVKVVVVGAPHLSTGEVAVFFLTKGADNIFRPVGLSLGIYPVAMDPLTRQSAITPPLAVGFTTAAGAVIHGDPARKMMTLSEFSSLVHLIMASQARTLPRGGRS